MPLGDVLGRVTETVTPSPDQEYREITVKLWGRGVVQRRVVAGAQLNSGRRFVARAGQLILSRIDARNGAIGIVPQELDGALVTSDFPLFTIDQARVETSFLGWVSKTSAFVGLCRRASEGTTNRVRLQEARFLALEVRLPPLAEQRRIVARLETIARAVGEVRALRKRVLRDAESLVTSLHLSLAGNRSKKLGDLVFLDEDPVRVQPTEEYPQVGVKSFGFGLFPKAATRGADTTYKVFNRLYDGALVLSQVKAWEGAVAVCGRSLDGWFVSPEYRTFRCVPLEARPGYLRVLVRTRWFWGRLGQATRGVGARRERTRPEHVVEIEMPMPDVTQQEEAESTFKKLDTFKALDGAFPAKLDALLPSILDQAFNGAL